MSKANQVRINNNNNPTNNPNNKQKMLSPKSTENDKETPQPKIYRLSCLRKCFFSIGS